MGYKDYEDVINRYVQDDDQLVTYKWLSKELEIHVNTAKEYLKNYWESHKDKEELSATFLLIGNLKNGYIQIQVVKDIDLSSAKSLYETITSEHLYSIQKTLDDIEQLAGIQGDVKYSAIKLRDPPEKEQYQSPERPAQKKPSPVKEKKQPTEVRKNLSNKIEVENAKEDSAKKTAQSDEKTEKSEKLAALSKAIEKNRKKPVQTAQKGFSNLFGKVPPPKPKGPETTEKKEDKKLEESKKSVEKKCKVISPKPKSNGKAAPKKALKNLVDSDSESDSDVKATESEEDKPIKKKKVVPKVQAKRRTKFAAKKDAEPAKKTFQNIRIDLSSDDEPMEVEKNDSDEDKSEKKDTRKRIMSRSPSPARNGNVKKVRKMVDQTFKDKDGYSVTKRVAVWETVEDDEPQAISEKKTPEPEKTKKTEKVEIAKTKKSKKEAMDGKKQTTLMSFFKKS